MQRRKGEDSDSRRKTGGDTVEERGENSSSIIKKVSLYNFQSRIRRGGWNVLGKKGAKKGSDGNETFCIFSSPSQKVTQPALDSPAERMSAGLKKKGPYVMASLRGDSILLFLS